MASVCLGRLSVVPRSLQPNSPCILIYQESVRDKSQVQQAVNWSMTIESGLVHFQQKHDYAVLWRSTPRKECVVFCGDDACQDRRFSRGLLRELETRGFVVRVHRDGGSTCRCGLLVETLIWRWAADEGVVHSIFEESFSTITI